MFQKLAEIADVSSLTKEERLHYDEALRKYRDTLCVLEGAEQRGLKRGREEGLAKGLAKGRAEGLAEGRAEGQEEKTTELIRKMLKENISLEVISKITGKSYEEIEKISKE